MTEIEQIKQEFINYNNGTTVASKHLLFQWLGSLITTIESLQSELKEESENRRECERASLMWKRHSEDQELLVIKRESVIESQKEEIEGLHDALEMLPPKNVEIHERTQFQIDKTVDRLLIESLQKEKEMSSHRHALYAGELREQIESLKAITELAVKALKEYKDMVVVDSGGWQNGVGRLARDTLSEIERLQNAQT